jgi:Protein of unknown function (DUF1254)
MRLFVCAATCRGAEPLLEGTPFQFVVTPNLDTPYLGLPLDLSSGPMVVELPPGPPMGAANDLNQRWVMGLGYFNPTRIHVFTHLKPASTGSSSRTSSCTSRAAAHQVAGQLQGVHAARQGGELQHRPCGREADATHVEGPEFLSLKEYRYGR